MSRQATINYGAEADTTFQWATTDDDLFDREFDLYRLSQAIDKHDHSANHGLAVSRIAAGAIGATALAPLAVQTTQINNLAVTNAKLAESAVTRNKIEWPLVQATNDMAGGFRFRETVGSYAFGFYVAANGLGVFGMGSPATINTNLILGQNGSLSVGTVQGVAKLNVVQTTNALGGGLRIYHSNAIDYFDWWMDATVHAALGTNGTAFMHFQPTTGFITLGPSATDSARLHLVQATDDPSEGIRFTRTGGGSVGQIYCVNEGSLYLGATGRLVQIDYTNSALSPAVSQGLNLGSVSKPWAAFFTTTANFASTATFATNATVAASLTANAIVVTGGHILPSVTNANTLGSTSNRFQGAAIGGATIDNNGVYPRTTGVHVLGSTGQVWFQIYANEAYKPSGGDWSVLSDDKVKMKTKFRPYTPGLEAVLHLRPTWFTYNGEYGTPRGEEYAGFRAEELKAVAPEMVKTIKTARVADEAEDEVETVNTSNLKLMLVNAIKELDGRIAALEGANAV